MMSRLYGKRLSFQGVFAVERGRGVLAKLLGGLMRLPLAGDAVVVQLDVVPEGKGERWIRRFDSRKLETYVSDHGSGLWSERFGPLEFWFRMEKIGEDGIRHRQVSLPPKSELPSDRPESIPDLRKKGDLSGADPEGARPVPSIGDMKCRHVL